MFYGWNHLNWKFCPKVELQLHLHDFDVSVLASPTRSSLYVRRFHLNAQFGGMTWVLRGAGLTLVDDGDDHAWWWWWEWCTWKWFGDMTSVLRDTGLTLVWLWWWRSWWGRWRLKNEDDFGAWGHRRGMPGITLVGEVQLPQYQDTCTVKWIFPFLQNVFAENLFFWPKKSDLITAQMRKKTFCTSDFSTKKS